MDQFLKSITCVQDDTQRRPIYKNVQYIIWRKTGVLNFVTVRYSLHQFKIIIDHSCVTTRYLFFNLADVIKAWSDA